MAQKIFVSYAHEDRGLLDELEETLRKHGVIGDEPVSIIDPLNEVKLGDNIREAIRNQIESASKVVIIYTDKSGSSDWVNYEVGMADALNKPIIIIGKKGSRKTEFLGNLDNVHSIEIEESGKP